ncbi:hypothetical protein VaNZ11_002510 [Volvox africanus]|uniref:FAD-binding domain-containing protein n=1 Tax=Volvox africanus TaxID=51714 RepID=A0ABQ5RSZ6_9CHLO|nr:hypothetical protein VaNZ11_002510 [Volvox africanus]
MTRYCGHRAPSTLAKASINPSCALRRSFPVSNEVEQRRSLASDVSVAATQNGLSAGSFAIETPISQHHTPNVLCRAVLVAEQQAAALPTIRNPHVTQGHASISDSQLHDDIDAAIIGSGVSGLAAALAVSKAIPGARVMLYDTASEPPTACDGGVLLSVNGLRALKALDINLFKRITSELASPLHEALWFDLEGELVRRAPLGQPGAAALRAAGIASSSGLRAVGGSRRKLATRSLQTANKTAVIEPDPTSFPLVVSLHDLREALSEALPDEVQIFGRHYVSGVETCAGGYGGGEGNSGMVLRFAASPGGSPMRSVRTKMLVGADGPNSAVKRLQFDTLPDHRPQPADRIVWRGRFTLRQRDPDIARLRNFTTASRTWVDLRTSPSLSAERSATLIPAGLNTYVWSASCPASLLVDRGLQEAGVSPYGRCMAMFEDFPQDFFAALRATAASAVVEYCACRPLATSAAASLAAPWQWFSGSAALVGDAVYSLPVDDVSSTAVNLTLEDAAVLGACSAQYGLTQRALQEYARQRGPRVSAMLAAPASVPERVRLRDAPFLPHSLQVIDTDIKTDNFSLTSTVKAAVDSAAAATAAVVSPSQPLGEVLARAAAASTTGSDPPRDAINPSLAASGRPSGGASRTAAPIDVPGVLSTSPVSGPSSPFFSRPSGARRLGPMPAAIAAVIGILTSGPGGGGKHAVVSATVATQGVLQPLGAAIRQVDSAVAAAASSPGAAAIHGSSGTAVEAPYAADSTPRSVWDFLLRTHGSATAGNGGAPTAVEESKSRHCYPIQAPEALRQEHIGVAGEAHDFPLMSSYKKAESPALVWNSLLGVQTTSLHPIAATAAPIPAVAADEAAAATAVIGAASSALQDNACALLPRPLHKPKAAVASPAAAVTAITSAPDVATAPPAPMDASPTSTVEAASSLSSSSAAIAAAAQVGAAPASFGQEHQQRRRRARGQAGPVSGRWAGGDRRGAARMSGGHSKSRRSSAASITAAFAAGNTPSAGAVSASKAKPKAVGAKAAATMTVSLSAAAALGGVIGVGTGHMPMDMTAALHAHGAVAQFWEDLNSLNLSSASLSSIDLP